MVIGGSDASQESIRDVEVVDFSDDNLDCSVSAPYPYVIEEAVAMFYPGRNPWNCGGFGRPDPQETENRAVGDCIRYDAETRSWTYTAGMNQPRQRAAGIALNSESVWVTGGYNGTSTLQSTELYQVENTQHPPHT